MSAALLATVVLGGVLFDGSARIEGRAGPRVEGLPPPNTSLLRLTLLAHDDEGLLLWRAGVAPQLLVANPGEGAVGRVFTRAHVAAELREHGGFRTQIRQDLGYGSNDLSPLGGVSSAPGPTAPAPGAQPLPAAGFLLLQESTTSGATEIALSSRTRLSADAAWQVSGGADEDSRRSVPLSRGVRLRAQMSYLITRLDALDAQVSGFDTRYSNGRRASAANGLLLWRTTPSRGLTLGIGAGPALGRGEDPTAGTVHSTLYTVRAELAIGPAAVGQRNLSFSLRAAAEPVGDQLSGDLTERGGITASATFRPIRELTLDASANSSLALTSGLSGASGTVRGDRYAQSELRATYVISTQVDASMGGRGAWLSHPLGNFPRAQWAVFAALTFYPFRR